MFYFYFAFDFTNFALLLIFYAIIFMVRNFWDIIMLEKIDALIQQLENYDQNEEIISEKKLLIEH